jgi:rSAM/selenodomain-associated transferase 1
MSNAQRIAVGVMAKAPIAGRSKTRLCPPLTHAEAAAMSAAFLGDITANIARAGLAAPLDGWIAYAPAGGEALFDGLLAPGTRLVLADGAIAAPEGVTGFGRCLLHAMQAMFAMGYGAACVLNSDSPTLPTSYLLQLADALRTPGERVVLGAAEDGGYYVLGAKAAHAHLFADIAWSTDTVAAQTRARASALGLPVLELPPWYDVDDGPALARAAREVAGLGSPIAYHAPATAASLARIGRAVDLANAAE